MNWPPPNRDDPSIKQGRGDRCRPGNWHGYRDGFLAIDCMFSFAEAAAWMRRGAPDETW